MKLSVICHSVTGNTRNMGEAIVRGMNSVENAEARLFSIDAVDYDFANASRCIIFGSPIYAAHITSEMMNFLLGDGGKIDLAGKLCGAYTTAQYVHGGAELGISEMMNHMLVKGGLYYSSGAACGKPYIHLGPVGIDHTLDIEQFIPNFEIYGKRMAEKAAELFG